MSGIKNIKYSALVIGLCNRPVLQFLSCRPSRPGD